MPKLPRHEPGTSATALFDGSLADGVRLMEHAVALGHRRDDDLLELARRLVDTERAVDALAVLELLEPEPGRSAELGTLPIQEAVTVRREREP